MFRRTLAKTAAWLHHTRFWLCWYTNADSAETAAYTETMLHFQRITAKSTK